MSVLLRNLRLLVFGYARIYDRLEPVHFMFKFRDFTQYSDRLAHMYA